MDINKDSDLPINQNIKDKINCFLNTNKIPHIIFHGSSGTGKRTIVYDFIHKIYNQDKQKIKTNVMFVNCAHAKGIKFIRDDIKFFAKTNIQSNSGVVFKTIVLMNADFLTIDAQSALRRCIELFSYNTRFFIIVDNKNKLLNPILSRFCEIYVPEYIENDKVINLHQYSLNKKMNFREHEETKMQFLKKHIPNPLNESITQFDILNICHLFYENGLSCLDIMNYVENSGLWSNETAVFYLMEFYKIKAEYRCEKLLMFYMLELIYLRQNNI